MESSAVITMEDLSKLAEFHRKHFPHQIVPDIQTNHEHQEAASTTPDASDLGCYEDGTRRTLTDDQIAMFRHSEIQRLLTARRHRKMAEEEEEKTRKQRPKGSTHTRSSQFADSNRFDDDSSAQDRYHVNELSYDENTAKRKEKTFQWPVLSA